jgi:hypothetical protein
MATTIESFGDALARGRAFLLLGQRHSDGVADRLAADVAACVAMAPAGSLPGQYSALESAENALRAAKADALSAYSFELDEVANNPWEGVWTTAIDSAVVNSFGRASGRARPVRVLFPRSGGPVPALRSGGTLNILQLFGRADEDELGQLPPLSPASLQRRTLFDVSPLLDRLPSILAPGSAIVIAGLGADDWLGVEILGLALRDRVPDDSVHWFQPYGMPIAASVLKQHLGSAVVVHDISLVDALSSLSSSPIAHELEDARARTFDTSDLEITVGRPDGHREVVRLGFEARQRLGAAVQVLGDHVFRTPPALSQGEERQALREFLRKPQYLPDWGSVARGFLFERDALETAAEKAEQSLRHLRSARHIQADEKGVAVVASRIPLLLCGPPAAGKTRTLHLLAYRLRERGFCVVYLPGASAGAAAFEPIGRACRVLQSAGSGPIAVMADDLDGSDYSRLSDNLSSAGISALVIGTSSTMPNRNSSAGIADRPHDLPPETIAVEIPAVLTPGEIERLRDYLDRHGFVEPGTIFEKVGQPLFLLLLHNLLPDTRGNIRRSLESEYERLMSALDDLVREADGADMVADEQWRKDLEAIRQALFSDEAPNTDPKAPASRLTHDPLFREVVNACLFCSQLQRPAPLGLLLRAFAPELVRHYAAFSEAIASTAVLSEVGVSLDESAIDTQHPLVAELLLRSVMPEREAQLRTIRPLVEAVGWSNEAYPGEVPDQDYILALFQAIGDRSHRGGELSAPHTLNTLIELLRLPRERYGITLPTLLLLEGNTWRFLADKDGADFGSCLTYTSQAEAALDLAEAVLNQRKPTAGRNSSLTNVLTTKAAALGYMIGAYLKVYPSAQPQEQALHRKSILDALAEVDRLTSRARGLSGGFYPSDVNFWNHKDVLQMLPDLSEAERVQLVSKLGSILEEASEQPIDSSQIVRYRTRQITLQEIEGNTEVGEALAASLREAGDYSGEVILARSRAFLPGALDVISKDAAAASLGRLESFAPGILRDPAALSVMNRLWMSVNLPRPRLGGEEPILARCDRSQWAEWRRILEARVALPDGQDNPYYNFCLAWALLELDESLEAASLLHANARISVGHRWRVGPLAVLTDETGAPIVHRARVRRRDGVKLVVYVPSLATEIRVDPSLEKDIPLEARAGDELEFAVGVNYHSMMPWFGSDSRPRKADA